MKDSLGDMAQCLCYRVDYGGREKKKCNLTHTLEKVGNTAGDDAQVVKLTEE